MGDSRLDVLNAQLQTSWFMLWAGLEGLSDEEYTWEPVPGSWSVRLHADGFWKRDAETLWRTNRDLIAAGAEILLLRNLYRPG